MTKYILTENEIKRIVKETIQEYIEKFRKEVFDLSKITPEMAERTEEKEMNKKKYNHYINTASAANTNKPGFNIN